MAATAVCIQVQFQVFLPPSLPPGRALPETLCQVSLGVRGPSVGGHAGPRGATQGRDGGSSPGTLTQHADGAAARTHRRTDNGALGRARALPGALTS